MNVGVEYRTKQWFSASNVDFSKIEPTFINPLTPPDVPALDPMYLKKEQWCR
jgi:hypothetical protein